MHNRKSKIPLKSHLRKKKHANQFTISFSHIIGVYTVYANLYTQQAFVDSLWEADFSLILQHRPSLLPLPKTSSMLYR